MPADDNTRYDEVGTAGRGNRGGYAGGKLHRLVTEYRDGRLVHAAPLCGCCQGQFAARPIPGATAAQVTCEKCGQGPASPPAA